MDTYNQQPLKKKEKRIENDEYLKITTWYVLIYLDVHIIPWVFGLPDDDPEHIE